MAEILPFPDRTLPEPLPLDDGDDEWLEDDAPGGIGLALVTTLAATPSRTFAELAGKVEVLVKRLLPDDGSDAGLCAAEAALLCTVSREIRRIADSGAFALHHDDGSLPLMSAEAK